MPAPWQCVNPAGPSPAELGRVASHFYIRHSSIVLFNEHLKPHMTEADVLAMVAQSSGAWRPGRKPAAAEEGTCVPS